jgi:hypothetical protein
MALVLMEIQEESELLMMRANRFMIMMMIMVTEESEVQV